MRILYRAFQSILMAVLVLAPAWARAPQGGDLTSAEVERVRDAQEPSQRIEVYLSIAETRLQQIEGLRQTSPEARANLGGQIDELLGQYISIDSELKDWIQYQYNHGADVRGGLRRILQDGPKQLQQLQRLQSSAGPGASDYATSLRDAIANLNDTIDGATQALAAQQKKFPEMKSQEKAETRALKKERKEEAKQNKKEQELEKKEEKQNEKERELREKQQKNDSSGDSGEN
jgi:septal ring factor EnvC (AmiA/AmiB activator)